MLARWDRLQPVMPSRAAFTLVELLAVILIIALLMALVTPAVMQALSSARNAAIKAEIDMLHMAVMNYRNEYGSFPPASVPSITGSDLASRHLMRLFPRMPGVNAQTQAQRLCFLNTGTNTTSSITPSSALPFWLYGYTDDPTQPVFVSTTTSRKKLFDFDASRLAGIGTSTVSYHAPGKPAAPYVYINSGTYGTLGTSGSAVGYVIGTGTYRAETQVLGTGTFFFNADTFQILSAGRDEMWNTDDDLSNFWPGTRAQFRESR
jgi:prepilin-type N-terminal cleavage/methylation domain-containing protein